MTSTWVGLIIENDMLDELRLFPTEEAADKWERELLVGFYNGEMEDTGDHLPIDNLRNYYWNFRDAWSYSIVKFDLVNGIGLEYIETVPRRPVPPVEDCALCERPIDPDDATSTPFGSAHIACAVDHESKHPEQW